MSNVYFRIKKLRFVNTHGPFPLPIWFPFRKTAPVVRAEQNNMKRGNRSTSPVLSVCLSIIKKMSGRWPGLPRWCCDKESACQAGDTCLIPGWRISPGEGNGNPFLYSCLEKSHGQRSLVGYSLWGCKELDMT